LRAQHPARGLQCLYARRLVLAAAAGGALLLQVTDARYYTQRGARSEGGVGAEGRERGVAAPQLLNAGLKKVSD
jgi:hypothetical protein